MGEERRRREEEKRRREKEEEIQVWKLRFVSLDTCLELLFCLEPICMDFLVRKPS